MPLLKLEVFDPDYRDTFEGGDIIGFDLYVESGEKIGAISDVLVDEEGHFRYFVVDLSFWVYEKKVLLPSDGTRIDYSADQVYAVGMTKEQAEGLHEFNDLVPAPNQRLPRIPGQDQGKVIIAPDFNDPLPEDILKDFLDPGSP